MSARKLNILVIDDQKDQGECLLRVLRAQGYSCESASSGKEGLVKLSEARYDVVILDLIMPGIDGEAVLVWVRSRFPKTTVVIASAQDDEGVMRDMLGAGATAYLVKPISEDQLLSVMRGVENRRTAAGLDVVSAAP